MTDELEDRLRAHLAAKAAQVQADPDPRVLMERSVGGTGRGRPLLIGAVAIAVVFAGSGVLTGVNLVGGGSTATPVASAPSTTVPGGAGAALTPRSSGASSLPTVAVPAPYAFLFTRTTSSGVTIRAYRSTTSTTGGCTSAAACTPLGTVPAPTPCPQGALCAQPVTVTQTQNGVTGDAGTSAGAVASSGGAVGTAGPAPTPSTGSGPMSTVPTPSTATCGQLEIELSTDRAVGTGSVPLPTSAPPSPDTVELLGVGSFGTAEAAPVGWVAVWVGSAVTSVHLNSGGSSVDDMAPSSGVVVLAVPGIADLTGSTVVGLDRSGAAVASVPADQLSGSDASGACSTTPIQAPGSTTTSQPPVTRTTTSTTTSTTSTTTAPSATTTTTTTPTPPTPQDLPITSQGGR